MCRSIEKLSANRSLMEERKKSSNNIETSKLQATLENIYESRRRFFPSIFNLIVICTMETKQIRWKIHELIK